MKSKKHMCRHKCRLSPLDIEHELPRHSPFAPSFHKWLSNFRINWMTVSRMHPNSYKYMRSAFAIHKEKHRQLSQPKYRLTIHPLSKLALISHFVFAVLWLIMFIYDPFTNTFLSRIIDKNEDKTLDQVQLVLNFFFSFQILFSFFEGHIDHRSGHIVLTHSSIVRSYLTSYFIFDLMPIIYDGVEYLIMTTSYRDIIIIIIPQMYCLRFVRLPTMLKYFSVTMTYFNIHESIIKCTTIALAQIVLIHWWTCVFYFVPTMCYYYKLPVTYSSWVLKTAVETNRSTEHIYMECLLCIMCHYLGAGVAYLNTRNPIEMIILSVILICGLAIKIYVVAIILQLFGALNVSGIKYEQFMFQLNEYMMMKKFSTPLRARLRIYYEYRFQKQFFNEDIILSGLSEHLRNEVYLYSCRNLINKMLLLRGAPKNVIGSIVACLKQEIYLPGDFIIKSDGYNEFVYFISFGTISVYSQSGKEIDHMEDGHHFGDIGILTRDNSQMSVMAIETTEVFYLEIKIFMNILADYPKLMDRLENCAQSNIAIFKATSDDEHYSVTGQILSELRKGNILENRRNRKLNSQATMLDNLN